MELANVVAGAVTEIFPRGCGREVLFAQQLGEQIGEAGNDLFRECEIELPRARDVDGTEFAGPWIDVLKDMRVNRFQVGMSNLPGFGRCSSCRMRRLVASASKRLSSS